MATTKIGAGVVDLNSDNTSFKMPVGSSSFTGTPVAGMIRNNTSLTNNDAATALRIVGVLLIISGVVVLKLAH